MDHHSSCRSAEIAPNQSELRWAIAELVARLLIAMMIMIKMIIRIMLMTTRMIIDQGARYALTCELVEIVKVVKFVIFAIK